MARLGANRYGKARVRVMKLDRTGPQHKLHEWNVRVLLEGSFESAHISGDNTAILPTDTMKNTVYARAKLSLAETPEEFALELAEFLVHRNEQVTSAEIQIESVAWNRLTVHGKPHESSFTRGSDELATATCTLRRNAAPKIVCGIEDMTILKSAQSRFEGFIRDEYTTLRETADRLFATSLSAEWSYDDPRDFDARRKSVREAMLAAFAAHDSKSVQQTLYAMAEAAIASVPSVVRVHMVMPNKHCLLVDLKPFGLANDNEIFVPTDDPHGYIEATVERD